MKVELDLSNYATKVDLKNATGVDTTDDGELHINKLRTPPVELSQWSNIANNDAVKKTEYNKLASEVNVIDASGIVSKTQYNTEKLSLET